MNLCTQGYYRSGEDATTAGCTSPPSAPRNLTLVLLDSTSLTLAWQQPRDTGGRDDIRYRVECVNCGSGVAFSPSSPTIASTFIKADGLAPVSTYRLRVYAENGVSREAVDRRPRYAEITVNTESADPGSLPSPYIKNVKSSAIRLGWRAPPEHVFDIQMYEVRYFVRGSVQGVQENNTTLTTRNDEIEIPGLRERTEYGFQVRAKQTASQAWGEWSQVVYQRTGAGREPEAFPMPDAAGTPAIVGAVVAGLVLLTIITIMITLYMKRGSDDWVKKQQVGDSDTLEFRGTSPHHYSMDGGLGHGGGIVHTHTAGTLPLFNTFATHKTYIDPHTYEDPHQAGFAKTSGCQHVLKIRLGVIFSDELFCFLIFESKSTL